MKVRAVIDSNIFVSGLILKSGNPYKILESWRNNLFTLLTSDAIIQEISKVLYYPKIQKKYLLTQEDINEVLNLLEIDAFKIGNQKTILKSVTSRTSRDVSDNKFLACAIQGKANFIVTGDQDLLVLKNFEGIPIISPSLFVKHL